MKREVKVTILGSGTCVPQLRRSSCAVLAESGGTRVLLDLGMGTVRRLLEYGLGIHELTHLLLSHFHPDHTAELVPLLFATKYPDGPGRRRPLTILGGTGLKRFYKGLRAAYGEWVVLPEGQMTLAEIDTLAGESLPLGDFRLTARPVNHRPESLAYRLETPDGVSVVYSGDTDESPALSDLAQGADLFICEASRPDDMKTAGHLTPSAAGRHASRAAAAHLVLTHLYPPCDQVDIVKQARSTYNGPVTVAEDLMSFILKTRPAAEAD